MINISLNGREIPLESQPITLLELVASVERAHVPENHIVVEVLVGGEKIEGFTNPDGSLLAYDPNSVVAINTRSKGELMVGILLRFERYLERLTPGLMHIVELLRSGASEEANKQLMDVAEGMRTLIDLIQNIRETGMIGDESVGPEGKRISDLAVDLKSTLEELVAGQVEGDNDRIADALEFEFVAQVKSWQVALPEMRRIVEARESGGSPPQ